MIVYYQLPLQLPLLSLVQKVSSHIMPHCPVLREPAIGYNFILRAYVYLELQLKLLEQMWCSHGSLLVLLD